MTIFHSILFPKFRKLTITFKPSLPVLCRPTNNVRHVFFKEVGTILEGRHKTVPTERQVHAVIIRKKLTRTVYRTTKGKGRDAGKERIKGQK